VDTNTDPQLALAEDDCAGGRSVSGFPMGTSYCAHGKPVWASKSRWAGQDRNPAQGRGPRLIASRNAAWSAGR
jgi:hypothetical protein